MILIYYKVGSNCYDYEIISHCKKYYCFSKTFFFFVTYIHLYIFLLVFEGEKMSIFMKFTWLELYLFMIHVSLIRLHIIQLYFYTLSIQIFSVVFLNDYIWALPVMLLLVATAQELKICPWPACVDAGGPQECASCGPG